MTLMDFSLIARLGWTLLHFLWQGVVVAAFLALAMWLLKGSSPRLRYGVACLALVLMATAPVFTWVRLGQTPPQASEVSRNDAPRPAVSAPIAPLPVLDARNLDHALPWAVGFWAIGVVILSLRLAGGWAWLQWLRRRPRTVPGPDKIQLRLLRLCGRMGLASNIRIFLCDGVRGPTVMGWLRPVILVPPAALMGMTPDQMELILAHELAHILRHDYAVNLIQSCVEVLLFYHPAVWWISSKIRQERELCCDDLAVRTTGDALDYATALTRLESLCLQVPSHSPTAKRLLLAATGGSFMNRIQRLILPITPTQLAPRAGLVLLLLFGGAFALQARIWRHQAPGQADVLSKGAIRLRRYDADSIDGKRKAGTVDLRAEYVSLPVLERALETLLQLPPDPVKGYVELNLDEAVVLDAPRGHWTYRFTGVDPARIKGILIAKQLPSIEKPLPGWFSISRRNSMTPELAIIPRGLNIDVWAEGVPADMVLQGLIDLEAKAPTPGITQEIRRQVLPDSSAKANITIDLRDVDPGQFRGILDNWIENHK